MDGKKVASQILQELKSSFISHHRPPGLAMLVVGDRVDSLKYVQAKRSACAKIGIDTSKSVHLKDSQGLKEAIMRLNEDETVDGILLQLPLPIKEEQDRFINLIDHRKDVDGIHPYNMGMLCRSGQAKRNGSPLEYFNQPCTPVGVMDLLKRYNVDVVGKKCVVLGRSNIVGLPLAIMLMNANATVTLLHSHSINVIDECRQADILIAAIGKPKFVKGDWLKPNAVVVDVGINADKDGKLVGDVDFEEACKVASLITPVPGGVGPMTVAMLMKNTLLNYKLREH